MNMQVTMGRLLEAVESLKNDSREQRTALSDLTKEIHGYKIGIRWALAICVLFSGLIGWIVSTYISTHPK